MSWIRRETEKGTVQYICPRCHDYHEFREDFGERTFSENYIFCRRCGARNGTGNAPTLTPPNEWVSVEERLPEKKQDVLMLFKSGNMAVGWWHDSDEHITFWCAYTDDGFYTDCDDIPVYWMPLPAPPDRRPDCVDERGWCKTEKCRGFSRERGQKED